MVSTWNLNESMDDSGSVWASSVCTPLVLVNPRKKKLPLIAAASLKHLDMVTILLRLCSNIM